MKLHNKIFKELSWFCCAWCGFLETESPYVASLALNL